MGHTFASRIRPVVTDHAIAGDVHMIEICRYPGIGRVAVFTIVATCYVHRILTGCNVAVMTGAATT